MVETVVVADPVDWPNFIMTMMVVIVLGVLIWRVLRHDDW